MKSLTALLAVLLITIGCGPCLAEDANYEMSGVNISLFGNTAVPGGWHFILKGALLEKHSGRLWTCEVHFLTLIDVKQQPDGQRCTRVATNLSYPGGTLHVVKPDFGPQPEPRFADEKTFFFVLDEVTGAVRLCQDPRDPDSGVEQAAIACNDPFFWPTPDRQLKKEFDRSDARPGKW